MNGDISKILEEVEDMYLKELDSYTDIMSRGVIRSIEAYHQGKLSAYEEIIKLIKKYNED